MGSSCTEWALVTVILMLTYNNTTKQVTLHCCLNADFPNFEPNDTTDTELKCFLAVLFRAGHIQLRKALCQITRVETDLLSLQY